MKENTIDPALAAMMAPEAEQAKELFPGMTVEEIRAVYFNADALQEPAYRLYQLNSDGYRYYYRFDANGEPEFYPSVTTLLKQVMPTPPALLDWMVANGKENSTEKRDIAAAYGTFMHGQFEQLIINRRYDFDNVPAVLLDYMERENVPESLFNQWIIRIRKDVLAFAQFVKDYNVKPLAVEIGLVHPEFHYAGCLDLPCVMTDPKTAKTFTAIVDFKSGRKGFFEEHELQLHLYREMWNYNYPNKPIERVFNFSPKDWRKSPTYNLKDQTDSVNAKKLPFLLALASIEDEKRDNTLTIVRGVLDLDNGKIADNIFTLSLSELIKTKSEDKDRPEHAASAPEPETPGNGQKEAQISTRKRKTPNDTENVGTAEKSEKPKKQPIRAGGAPTPYDVCEHYCKEKNCDYCLGEHGGACIEAKARAGYVGPEDDFVTNHLPWEKEFGGGAAVVVNGNGPDAVVKATPIGPAPEPAKYDVQENLLNFEMEL